MRQGEGVRGRGDVLRCQLLARAANTARCGQRAECERCSQTNLVQHSAASQPTWRCSTSRAASTGHPPHVALLKLPMLGVVMEQLRACGAATRARPGGFARPEECDACSMLLQPGAPQAASGADQTLQRQADCRVCIVPAQASLSPGCRLAELHTQLAAAWRHFTPSWQPPPGSLLRRPASCKSGLLAA